MEAINFRGVEEEKIKTKYFYPNSFFFFWGGGHNNQKNNIQHNNA